MGIGMGVNTGIGIDLGIDIILVAYCDSASRLVVAFFVTYPTAC